jgi:hypothetical protein
MEVFQGTWDRCCSFEGLFLQAGINNRNLPILREHFCFELNIIHIFYLNT